MKILLSFLLYHKTRSSCCKELATFFIQSTLPFTRAREMDVTGGGLWTLAIQKWVFRYLGSQSVLSSCRNFIEGLFYRCLNGASRINKGISLQAANSGKLLSCQGLKGWRMNTGTCVCVSVSMSAYMSDPVGFEYSVSPTCPLSLTFIPLPGYVTGDAS